MPVIVGTLTLPGITFATPALNGQNEKDDSFNRH